MKLVFYTSATSKGSGESAQHMVSLAKGHVNVVILMISHQLTQTMEQSILSSEFVDSFYVRWVRFIHTILRSQ